MGRLSRWCRKISLVAAAVWAIAPACSSPGGATSDGGGHAGTVSSGGQAGTVANGGGGQAGTGNSGGGGDAGGGAAGTSPGGGGGSGGQAGTASGGGAGASGSSGSGGAGGGAGVSGGGGGPAGTSGGAGRGGGGGASGTSGTSGAGGRGGAGAAGAAGGGGRGGAAGTAGNGGGGLGGRPPMSGRAVSIALGSTNTCAVLEGGIARCWGQGLYGVLGFTRDNIGDNEYPASTPAVPVGAPVTQMVVGQWHACALLTTGAVRCWGQGTDGQLGYGDQNSLSAPPNKNVNLGGLRAIQIAAGDTHTCALLEGGTVRCWGHGYAGALGYGNTLYQDLLAPPLADIDVGGKVVQIACGGQVTCAILDNGALRCWGVGILGRLGYGNETTIGEDETPASVGDVPVGGKVVQVSISFTHTCALLDTGGVRCWGYAGLGELGYGNITNNIGDNETPASVGDVPVGGPAAMVVVGRWHSCAVMAAGGVRCWGLALNGEVGYGNTRDIGDNETPASAGDVMIGGGTVMAIEAGEQHTCVLLAGGAIRCWGDGGSHLGYGNETSIGDDEVPAIAGDVPF